MTCTSSNNAYQWSRLVMNATVSICVLFACGEIQDPTVYPQQPNVIVVMTDDQGYGELSFHGNPILKTPRLDELAGQSVRLNDYHVAPMCTPTRGQLMTGLDAARNGAINVSSGRTLLRAELPIMANYFADNGYTTGLFGKWHLGDNYPYRPEDRGFQETLWFPSSHVGSVPDYWGNDYNDDVYIRNGKRKNFSGYCTDIYFDHTMDFIQSSIQADKPFFVYLPTNTPHYPLIAPEEDVRDMEAAFEASELKDINPNLKDRLIHYLAMIRNIDTNMGRLMDFLDEIDLADNTILMFATDNGSTFGEQYYPAGMRGRKTQLWEGGHRVPCFLRWPGGGFTEPRAVEGLTQVQDILPTLIDLCKLETPGAPALDGISLAPVLRGESDVPEDRMFVINYSRMPGQLTFPTPESPSIMRRQGAGVLWKRWRYLEDRELYDLNADPMQTTNVIKQYPDIAERMQSHLYNWWDEVEDIANEVQPVTIGHDAENPSMLTACEWVDVFVDQQGQIHQGVRKNSYWQLQVEQAGDYEFELRRWPREADIALTNAPPGDVALPIARARFSIDGNLQMQKPNAGDKFAKFTARLNAGPVTLQTWFDNNRNQPLCGAYYVYVKRL
jgi:arylsulfatase A-like enzyme